MTTTTTILGELLKNLYSQDDIENLVNLTVPALERCARKGSAQLGGNGFFFPVRTESAHGFAYITESADLPTNRDTVVQQAQVDPKVFAGVVKLTGLSMAVSSNSAAAFARAYDENVQQTLQAMASYKEGVLMRDGTGVISGINTDVTGAEIEVDDASPFRIGMRVNIYDDSGSDWIDSGATFEITAVDWANNLITLDTDPTDALEADTDSIYLAGSQDLSTTPSSTIEPIGLRASIDSAGTYLGINRATAGNGNWGSAEITHSAYLDESVLLQARTRVTQNSGITFQSMAGSFGGLAHPSQMDVLFKLAIPRIRYSGGEKIDLGNRETVNFGGIDFVLSHAMDSDKVYIGDWSKHQSLYTPGGELHIDTEYNGSALKWVSNKDVGQVFMKEYHAFANKNPRCFAKIGSLTQPTR